MKIQKKSLHVAFFLVFFTQETLFLDQNVNGKKANRKGGGVPPFPPNGWLVPQKPNERMLTKRVGTPFSPPPLTELFYDWGF